MMHFDMNELKKNYEADKGYRELKKWIFGVSTLGLGGLYLWLTTKVINEGQIGIRQSARGDMILLPPGRHSIFPWESYPRMPQSLSTPIIIMGPYKLVTVQTGYVAKTYNRGTLKILDAGQHLITDAAHTVDGIIPIKQETKKLHEVNASTSDNVGLVMHADVRYQIEDPYLAVTSIDDIENSIKEIAEISISQIVSHHTLADFAPATSTALYNDKNSDSDSGIYGVIKELTNKVTEQLAQLGIKLLNIGITSWKIGDTTLAHELAQGAVVKSQTQSKLMAAENAAQVLKIDTEAQACAIKEIAKAQGEALIIISDLAQELQPTSVAADLLRLALQKDLVSHANNCNLFFSPSPSAVSTVPPVVLTQSVREIAQSSQ